MSDVERAAADTNRRPARYKQSDLGLIPDEWEVLPLQRISPKQSVGLVINPSTYFSESGTVPMLVGSNVAENSINWEAARRISAANNQRLPASRLWAGDLVTVRVGEPGITSVVPPELDGCNCASMMIVRKQASFDSQWLCYAMNSWLGRKQVEHVQYGTAQKQFNISHAIDFLYPVPLLDEQRAIAQTLGDVDALLGALDRLIAKKRALKQAAMQQLLTGEIRLPGIDGDGVVEQTYGRGLKATGGRKQTDVGVIPRDWACVAIASVARLESGHTPSKREPSYWGGTIPWVSLHDTEELDGDELLTTAQMITEEGLNNSSARLLPQGTVTFSRTATVGKTTILGREMATSQDFANYICGPSLHNRFLVYLFRSMGRTWKSLMAGSIHNTIYMPVFKALKIALPPLPEQRAIAAALSDIDGELAVLRRHRDKTRALKQGVMQELLTGRIRLV